MRLPARNSRLRNWKAATSLALFLASSASFAQTSEPTPPAGNTNSPLDALEAAKKLSEAQKAASEAATAASNAKAAEIAAQTAAAKAQMGSIEGQSEIKGAVQAGSTPSKAEALLLVTRSTLASGKLIANRIAADLTANQDRDVLVLTDKAQLAISDAVLFDLRRDQLLQSADSNRQRFAQCPPPAATGDDSGGRMIPVATALGTAVDLASKLGSYFMTDYTYGEITVDPSPELLAAAVVHSFSSWTKPAFIIPSHSLISGATELIELMRPLQDQYLEAVGSREIALKYAEAHRGKSETSAALCDAAAAAFQKSISQYETLSNSLTADANDAEPLGVRIVRQKQIQTSLEGNPLVLLLTGRQAAAYYTKKNLWTFLGGLPLYTMGGTSTTYTLFEPKSGHILETGAVVHHAGYRSVTQVERLINSNNE